jgi:hypothetical protein
MVRTVVVIGAFVVAAFVAPASAQEDFGKLVAAALSEEKDAFDDVQERFEKGKLKPGEAVALFGKKKLTKPQQRERLAELRQQVEVGEASCRVLSLNIDDLKVGACGVLGPKYQPIKVEAGGEANEFFGSYTFEEVGVRNNTITSKSRQSREFLFVGVPQGDGVAPGKRIQIDVPLLITGRRGDVMVLEALPSAVQKMRAAEERKKKKAAKK